MTTEALTDDERAFVVSLLNAEARRRIERIQPGDSDDLRDTFVRLANRCDDVAAKIERGGTDAVSDLLFAARACLLREDIASGELGDLLRAAVAKAENDGSES